jgi:tetratricopeptide (TPR) repeat protein
MTTRTDLKHKSDRLGDHALHLFNEKQFAEAAKLWSADIAAAKANRKRRLITFLSLAAVVIIFGSCHYLELVQKDSNAFYVLLCIGWFCAIAVIGIAGAVKLKRQPGLLRLDYFAAVLYINRGTCFTILGHYQEAADDYDTALKLELTPEVRSTCFAQKALCLLRLNHTEEALSNLQTAVALAPDSSDVCMFNAAINLELDRFKIAKGHYDEALKKIPSSSEAYGICLIQRGYALAMLGMNAEAELDWQTACAQADANSALLYLRKGQVLQQQGDKETAMQCFVQANSAVAEGTSYHIRKQIRESMASILDLSQTGAG